MSTADDNYLIDAVDDLHDQVDRLAGLVAEPLLYLFPADAMSKLGGIHEHTVRRLIERGELITVVVDGLHYVTSRSIAAYVERLTTRGDEDPPLPIS